MRGTKLLSRVAASVVLMLNWSAPAGAVTIQESSVPGGDFSNAWATPSVIGNGFDLVQGTGAGNNYDILALTGMTPGAQSVTLTFAAPSGIDWSYAAGGSLLYSTTPFRWGWGWDGTNFGSVFLSYLTPVQTVTLDLDQSFGGTLYLGLYFTFGQDIGYRISLPGNLASVPLPAGALLLSGALAAAGVVRGAGRPKRRKAAQI